MAAGSRQINMHIFFQSQITIYSFFFSTKKLAESQPIKTYEWNMQTSKYDKRRLHCKVCAY